MLAMSTARLAQSVERKALNLVVVGSSPTVGVVNFESTNEVGFDFESLEIKLLWKNFANYACLETIGMPVAESAGYQT